ncbi:hypothetical protein AN640_00590 [Candidatus Epulonipiscium fishelsonii]|uniref:Uncharacterized protein n=1 Tax=Candidatus Epulonipiscium fishelsonii TaxID=77094 RepID=A0ACC8X7U4_9FIRM|nr:hypothetical protein AN640_00590 [Epulopiscium sp. SCG-D08WGA-EpuloA1]
MDLTIKTEEPKNYGQNIMGVNLGIKVPAVCVTANGRENKVIRRNFKVKRKQLGKSKKSKTIKKINNKENRIMQDKDHKYKSNLGYKIKLYQPTIMACPKLKVILD